MPSSVGRSVPVLSLDESDLEDNLERFLNIVHYITQSAIDNLSETDTPLLVTLEFYGNGMLPWNVPVHTSWLTLSRADDEIYSKLIFKIASIVLFLVSMSFETLGEYVGMIEAYQNRSWSGADFTSFLYDILHHRFLAINHNNFWLADSLEQRNIIVNPYRAPERVRRTVDLPVDDAPSNDGPELITVNPFREEDYDTFIPPTSGWRQETPTHCYYCKRPANKHRPCKCYATAAHGRRLLYA